MPAEKIGKVYLAGAGPADPGLVTVKTLDLIKTADTIVYDSLIPGSILTEARPDAELIYVGKSAGQHTMPQEEICDLLVKLGNEGKTVVRLKGGDPFVFGRGGEEALALTHNNIPFEIIPGVTSGIAAPAYAGIPVSHRNVATSIHLITGHEDPTKSGSQLDFEPLAKVHGTLVFYMGVANLADIAKSLIGFGKSPDTPSAVIHRGCTPHQRIVTGRLDEIADIATVARIKPPSIIVIGDVVALRDEIAWYEKAPLFGKTVVVTRARAQASKLASKLHALGADVIEIPAIVIKPVELSADDEAFIINTSNYGSLFFTSQNAVDYFIQVFNKHHLDTRTLANVLIASIGPATSEALQQRGIIPDIVADPFTSKGMLATFQNHPESKNVRSALLPRADIASEELSDGLRSSGIKVHEIDIYRTVPVVPDPELIDRIKNQTVDYVTFTSSSTVKNIAAMLGRDDFIVLSKRASFVSIGPVTSATIRELGADLASEAAVSDIDGLVDALIKDNVVNQ
jgi:uroporphyrinogen III methyltransferase / synthase